MKINLKKSYPWIVAVVAGLIGTALWDLIKPMLNKLFFLILDLSTLGLQILKNNMYVEIAKGFHEAVILDLYSFAIALIIGFSLGITFYLLGRKSANKEIEKNAKKNIIKTLDEEIIKDRLKIKKLLLFYMPFSIVISIVFIINLFQYTYINKAIVYFNQLEKIDSPYITKDENNLINSDFAEIKNKNDYEVLVNKLRSIAEKNKKNTPNFNIY